MCIRDSTGNDRHERRRRFPHRTQLYKHRRDDTPQRGHSLSLIHIFWGPPGIGKSQAARQIGEKLRANTRKSVNMTDVRLLLFNPIDLSGIPTANADKTLAVWLKPKIFQMDPADDVINILFLDEISSAPQSVQAAAYQITLDRVIGEHRLPENCIVIAAGNRTTDRSVAFKMPKALANRMMHIEITSSFDSWKRWALRTGINDRVIGFLSFRQSCLMDFETDRDDLAFPTPRSWELVSNVLNGTGAGVDEIYPLIAGIVGTAVSYTHLDVYKRQITTSLQSHTQRSP